jgi:hypothetical protein
MSDSSDPTSETADSAAVPQRWFYTAAVILMLVGVAAAFVQKNRESAVGVTVARRIAAGVHEEGYRNEADQLIRDAQCWEVLGLAAVGLAIVSWMIALWRREKHRGTWAIIVSLFALYVGLQLIMV